MSSALSTKLDKLEAQIPDLGIEHPRRVVRIAVTDQDVEAAYREAAEMGIDTSPDSDDLMIIRLIAFEAIDSR